MRSVLVIIVFLPLISLGQEKFSVNDNFTDKSQYFFDKFHKGKVYYEDGKVVEARLNYNVVLEEIHFLQNLKIKKFEDRRKIKKVKIGNYLFYRGDGKIFQTAYGKSDLMLLKRREADLSVIQENKGAYGMRSSTSATSRYTSIIQSNEISAVSYTVNFEEKSTKEVPVEAKFYLKYGEGFDYANKRRFYRYFRDHKKEIKSFIKENDLKLDDKKEDYIKLINYCSQFIEK